ncbi:MAG: hypothetical protein HYX38_22950 [Rhodospirillales bacterium]|nr:hypothetical protein [Rhodospirillales bacterium]
MNTFVKSLAAVAVFSLPGVAIAQMTDAAYCKALSVSYLKYVSTSLTGQNPDPPPVDVQYAMSQCQTGNPAAGIPVLEQKLRANKVNLPSREQAAAPKAATEAGAANCGAETWSTEKMMYVGTPCTDSGVPAAPPSTQ